MSKIIYKNTKPKYMDIYINWPNVSGTLLKAGTPIASNGTVANNDGAVGILANDVGKTKEIHPCQLIIAGELDLAAVQSSFGSNLTTACKDALDNIAFIQANGKPYTPAAELPAHTEADDGKVLKLVNNTPVWGYDTSPGLSLSESTMSIEEAATGTFTVTCSSDGTVSVASSDETKATAVLAGSTVTVTAVAAGSANITVSVTPTVNYAGATAVCAVTVTTPEP